VFLIFMFYGFFRFFFFSNKASFPFLIGLCKVFFYRRHAYNFFFNYDFNNFLEKIFSFFSLVLSNFFFKFSLYFSIVFEDLFSNFNLILNSSDYFNFDLSSIKAASFFFNKVIIYNYWFYNMS